MKGTIDNFSLITACEKVRAWLNTFLSQNFSQAFSYVSSRSYADTRRTFCIQTFHVNA
jgi:hypothetical protein